MFFGNIDAVIYDCPMWSAGHTAKAIAETVLPYFEQNHLSEKASLCKEILKDDISPKEAFSKSLQIDMNDEIQHFCHVIDMERYNAYINEHIEEVLKYDRKHNVFGSIEEKSDMNSLLSMLEGMTADCKQSLTEYQDDIQRNFDDKNGSPSITWVKDSTGERTAGNTDPITPLAANLKNLNLDTVMDKLSDLGLGFNIGG